MSSGQANRTVEPPSLACIAMLALALFALALPIVGPLDDHHFAERSHTHRHIYPDGRPVSHEHAGTKALPHSHSGRPGTSLSLERYGGSGDVVYLAGSTAGFLLAVMNAPYHNAPESLRPAAARGDGNNPLKPFKVLSRQPAGRNIAPLPPPPIA